MKNYESPELKVIKFETGDVITTSMVAPAPTETPGGGNNDLPFQPNLMD